MSDDGPTLLFREQTPKHKLTNAEKRQLKDFSRTLAARVTAGRDFTCLITNDDELRKLNKEFLHHDDVTDVLSFPAASPNGHLGEIAISAGRAAIQGCEFGHSLTEEICVLMLHGVLHLTGMDHERDGGAMARAEKRWRTELGLPSSLIARVEQPR